MAFVDAVAARTVFAYGDLAAAAASWDALARISRADTLLHQTGQKASLQKLDLTVAPPSKRWATVT